ncbi:MAG: hydrogenase expression/formation protein HypE [Phycisphaerales bacterium]|jgi:hydrogenase expression/formation protein HypE
MTERDDRILLAHGGGGRLSDELIRKTIQPRLEGQLTELADAAELELDSNRIYFTTDSYVVRPLFFNGGDIGKLAVCGTVNDLAVAGAKPVAISLSLIIETGFEIALLEKILDSAARAAKENDVKVVTGDTKTVEAGAADKLFINTAGIGVKPADVELGFKKIAVGDVVVVSGTIGDHGMTIISQREDIKFDSPLESDCAGLAGIISEVLKVPGVKFMRDPTRGGLAATLNEIAGETGLSIELNETDIPVNPTVQAAADVLGFDVLNIANEGKFVAIVSFEAAKQFIEACKNHPLGKSTSLIGRVCEAEIEPLVELKTKVGGRRIVQMPYGRELPRIC